MEFKDLIAKVKNDEMKLRWNLSPQTYADGISGVEITSQADIDRLYKQMKEKAGCYFLIDVWNMKANLAVACNKEDGSGSVEVIENHPVPYNLLVKAVEKQGGAINISGMYAIDDKIRHILKKALGEE